MTSNSPCKHSLHALTCYGDPLLRYSRRHASVHVRLFVFWLAVGQVRSDAKAEDLRKRGIEPVVCTLEDTDVLAKAASSGDVRTSVQWEVRSKSGNHLLND